MLDGNLPNSGNKFEAAEEQALSAWSSEQEPASEDVAEVEEDGEPVEVAPEDTEIDAVEPIEEDSEAEVVEEAPAFDPAQWDGRMESLPETIKAVVDPIHKSMERGMHKKFQEVADLRKEYERKLEALNSAPPPGPASDKAPPPPSSDMSYEEQVEAQDKRDAYYAKRAFEDHAKTLPQFQQVEAMAHQQEAAARVHMVQTQPGFTPEIGAAMAQIAESHPAYAKMLDTDDGSLVLFQTAKLAVENNALRSTKDKAQQAVATKATADIKKKAGAAQSAITRSGGTRKATPAENFASWGFAEAEQAALEKWESGKPG